MMTSLLTKTPANTAASPTIPSWWVLIEKHLIEMELTPTLVGCNHGYTRLYHGLIGRRTIGPSTARVLPV
jgi:hypothetical protein